MNRKKAIFLASVLGGGLVMAAVLSLLSGTSMNGLYSGDADLSLADASPLPNFDGGYVSVDGSGKMHAPSSGPKIFGFLQSQDSKKPPKANCSRKAIIYYASKAPENFQEERKGLLYGVRTHTNATAIDTPVGRIAGFNSCALVASSILRKAGCRWSKITANAKAVYDAAYRNGWRPTIFQDGGCIVAWNARWDGERTRIGRGVHAKTMPKNRVLFRHVGITTGSNISVDNSGLMSRPSESSTYRPILYEPPIYLCPSFKSARRKKK